MKSVSVIILTKNAGSIFNETLKMIKLQDCSTSEIIVIDSGSKDSTLETAQRYNCRIHRIKPDEFGHGRTRNFGVSLCDSDFVVFLSQDAVPYNNEWLSSLLKPLMKKNIKKSKLVAAHSRIIPGKNASLIEERDGGKELNFAHRNQLQKIDRNYPNPGSYDKRIRVNFNNISSCVIRDFLVENPFPDIKFGEDISWAKKVIESGYSIMFQPDSIVYHSHPAKITDAFRRNILDAQLQKRLFGYKARQSILSIPIFTATEFISDLKYMRKYKLFDFGTMFYSPFYRFSQSLGQYVGSRG